MSSAKIQRTACWFGERIDDRRLTKFQRFLAGLTGPKLFWPVTVLAVLASGALGLWIPAELHENAETALFFQGGADLGGGMAYGCLAVVSAFWGVWLAWNLSLRMHAVERRGVGFGWRVWRALLLLLPTLGVVVGVVAVLCVLSKDWLMGVLAGSGPVSTCRDIPVLAATGAAVAVASILWVAWLDGRKWPAWLKCFLAPAATALWLALGWDGQTPRAGQRLECDWEPRPAVRGPCHRAMLAWYQLFADIPQAGDGDSPLWFWTDGQLEFGSALERSRSALTLERRDDLPGMEGKSVFVFPVAMRAGAKREEMFPFRTHWHHGGYFLATDQGPVPVRCGVIDASRRRNVVLPEGGSYLSLRVSAKGARGERRSVGGHPKCAMKPLATLLKGKPIPVEVWVEDSATFERVADCLTRLNAAGFDEVFLGNIRFTTGQTDSFQTFSSLLHGKVQGFFSREPFRFKDFFLRIRGERGGGD